MSDRELERLLAESAPAGPDPALRARVLLAARRELSRPVPALDRFLARPLPWAVAASLLLAMAAGVRGQDVARAREARARTAAERPDDRVRRDLTALLGDAAAAEWVRGRLVAQARASRHETDDAERWLRTALGGDLR